MHSAVVMSNFFRVGDDKAFKRFVQKWGLTPRARDGDKRGFERSGKESFGIPRAHVGPDGRPVSGDILRDLAEVLLDGEVAVIFENIISPARAVVRQNAMAVKKGADPLRLSLNQIYDMAFEAWGIVPGKIDWVV